MGVPAHLSLVTLGVADLARSVEFYEALGWQQSGPPGADVAFFRFDNVVIGLFGVDDLAADAGKPSRPPGSQEFRGVTLAINVATPAGVDRMHAAFLAAGATAVKTPQPTEWGGYSGYVADPDGHLWELAHNPYSPEWAAPDPD